MLSVYLGKMEEAVYYPPVYFDNRYEDEWITDKRSIEIIRDVDKSDVVSSHLIEIPVLGPISPKELSGSVKTIMLMLFDETGRIFNASVCGDNCAKWILKIAESKDLTINLRHIMEFGDDEFEMKILNTGEIVHNMLEFVNVVGFGGKAYSVYIPRHKKVTFTGCEHVKIAVCDTPSEEDSEPQMLPPEHVTSSVLGVKPWERDTHFIIDGRSNAKNLCIGEAFITPGNWAGFPPHKHDEDRMPDEGILEEIYYFLFQPEQGFAVQCMYTKDREFDEAYRVKQDELVGFPKGYHTTVGAPGYNTYFLWLMAGEHQGFFRSNDPDHDWVSAVENMVKKNK